MDTTDVAAPEDGSGGGHDRWHHAAVRSKQGDDGGDASTETDCSVLVADARFSGDSLALSNTLCSNCAMRIQPDHHTVSETGERSLFLSVTECSPDDIEPAFDEDPTVDSFTIVQTFPDRRAYRVVLDDSAILLAPTSLELGAHTLSVEGIDGEWHATLQFPDREALIALRTFCEEQNISFSVDSLYETDHLEPTTNALTDLQRETLRTAYRGGYYDIPRSFSQTDLATELDVSTSAISHRLRRATAQLIHDVLVTSDDDEEP